MKLVFMNDGIDTTFLGAFSNELITDLLTFLERWEIILPSTDEREQT